jgi:soluble lytic murein transglycosylase-like protein
MKISNCIYTLAMIPALLLFLSAVEVSADTYYFIDSTGTIHFSDTPTDHRYKQYNTSPESGRKGEAVMPRRYDRFIREACDYYLVEFTLVKAMIKVESNFNHLAVSNKGAIGLMQLLPATASNMGVRNPFNPKENIYGGVRYLRYLLEYFNYDLRLSLAAYNAGISNVEKYNCIPPFRETRNYVKKVIKYRDKIKKEDQIQAYLQ